MITKHLSAGMSDPEPYVHQSWPAHFFGPNGENEVFNSAEEVPHGWLDHPNKHAEKAAKAATPKAPAPPTPPKPHHAAAGEEVDKAGVHWNPALHAGTKAKVGSGLWRMKVGVKRPADQSTPLPPPVDL